MREFTIFVDEMTGGSDPGPFYMIALSPSNRRGAMATKRYVGNERLAVDLQQRLRYLDCAVERFFASDRKHDILLNFVLRDEDAAYLGWLSDFDHNYIT
jgi:hypothetical protein